MGNSNELNQYKVEVSSEYKYFYLKQFDFDGRSESADIIEVTPCKENNIGIEIYPNPVNSGMLEIVGNGMTGVVKIYSAEGKFVFGDFFDEKLTLSASEFETGFYFVTIDNGFELITKKLIIQ